MARTGSSGSESSSSVKSATRTLDILEYIVGHGRPASAVEIATALNIPISSLSYLLGTLIERRYLERDGRLHSPGPALAKLHPPERTTTLSDRVTPRIRSISLQLNETAAFFIRQGYEMEAIASEVSSHALRYTVEIGRLLPLHAFAAGKAVLATFDETDLADYFGHIERTAFTSQTVVDERQLRETLAEIRATGFAHTEGEYTPGIVGMGRAVRTADGTLLGAISVAVPAARMTEALEERASTLLERAAEALGAGN